MKFSISAAFLFAVAAASAQVPYKVIVPAPGVDDGAWMYMSDFDRGMDIDSVRVSDHCAVFKGDVDEPYMVTFSTGGKCYGTLVLEQGTSTINQASGFGVGTMLNDRLKYIIDSLSAVAAEAGNADGDSVKARYVEIEREAIAENSDNPIAYFIFLDLHSCISPDEQARILEDFPQLGEYERVKRITAKPADK